MVVSFLAVFGTNLNLKERLFIPIAWLPKATVQVSMNSLFLVFIMDELAIDFRGNNIHKFLLFTEIMLIIKS